MNKKHALLLLTASVNIGFASDAPGILLADLPPPPPTAPLARSISHQVQADESRDFTPVYDLKGFDWDETCTHKISKYIRALLGNLFGAFEEDVKRFQGTRHDGRVFIISNGNSFLRDDEQGIAKFTIEPFLPNLSPDVAAKTVKGNFEREDGENIDIYYYPVDKSKPQNEWNPLITYYPKYRAFQINFINLWVQEEFNQQFLDFIAEKHPDFYQSIDEQRREHFCDKPLPLNSKEVKRFLKKKTSSHAKALVMPYILEFIGFTPEHPVRNVYFVDNDAKYLRELVDPIYRDTTLMTGELVPIHMPYAHATKSRNLHSIPRFSVSRDEGAFAFAFPITSATAGGAASSAFSAPREASPGLQSYPSFGSLSTATGSVVSPSGSDTTDDSYAVTIHNVSPSTVSVAEASSPAQPRYRCSILAVPPTDLSTLLGRELEKKVSPSESDDWAPPVFFGSPKPVVHLRGSLRSVPPTDYDELIALNDAWGGFCYGAEAASTTNSAALKRPAEAAPAAVAPTKATKKKK